MFSNTVYDKIKYLVQIVLPAVSAAYFTLAQIYGWDNAEQVVGTIAVLTTFLGVSLGFSSKTYNKEDPGFDGALHIHTDTSGVKVLQLELNKPAEVVEEKDTGVFHVKVEDNEFWSQD